MLFQKQNMPTNTAKALENRTYDLLHGYKLELARTAIEAVLAEINRQLVVLTPVADTILTPAVAEAMVAAVTEA